MHQRFQRIGGSFLIVLLAYWGYALVAVPWIEPQAAARPTAGTENKGRHPIIDPRAAHPDIEYLFGPKDWERRDPIVLENDRGKLLIGKYKNLPDGRVEISPCTMIFTPSADIPHDVERFRRSVVLQAVKAELEFDEPFEIRRGRIGKLLGGRLVGRIVIRSDQKLPGPEDDLRIETHDVQLSEDRVFTPHLVQFRWGRNTGSGRQMRIDLQPEIDPTGKSRGPRIGGLKSFELARDVRLEIFPASQELRAAVRQGDGGAESPIAGSLAKTALQSPVQITCRGPMRFQLAEQVATLQDHVDIVQLHPQGPSDQISGELLAIHFVPKTKSAASATAANRKQPSSIDTRLEPSWLEMQGHPVVVLSPSNLVTARGQRLEYDLPTRRVSLFSEREVVVTRDHDEIRSRELHYEPGEKGRLGRFLAVGPGWLRGAPPEKQVESVEAHWSQELRIRPDPQDARLEVISLVGEAQLTVPGMGGVKADELHAWVWQRPVAVTNGLATQHAKTELTPDRLLAAGHVTIDSPQLTGNTDRLEVWFEQIAPSGNVAVAHDAAVDQGLAGNTASAQAGASTAAGQVGVTPTGGLGAAPVRAGFPGMNGQNGSRFDVSGRLLRVQVATGGGKPELREIILQGQAHFAETKFSSDKDKPLLVRGDLVHLQQPTPLAAMVAISGQPAHVEAGGLELEGATINLNRGENRLWIDGAGLMTMLVDRDLQGRKLDLAQPLRVQWRGRMEFNGLVAGFERDVLVESKQQQLRTHVLEITLSSRVDFAERMPKARPDLAKLTCKGGVTLDGRSYDAQGLLSLEKMQLVDLALDQVSGEVVASGPGWITQTRRGSASGAFAVPAVKPSTRSANAVDAAEDTINYLRIDFKHDLTGNLHRKEMTFGDRVQTVYGPIPDWESTLDPNRPEGLGERGVVMNCDRLRVSELPGSQGKGQMELQASGNTSVDGATFRALATRITYAAEKQLLVIEGDGHTDAELHRQEFVGGPTMKMVARTIRYWRTTNSVEVIEARSVNGQIPGKP